MSVVKLKLIKAEGDRSAFPAYAGYAASREDFCAEDAAGILPDLAGYTRSACQDIYGPLTQRLNECSALIGVQPKKTEPVLSDGQAISARLTALETDVHEVFDGIKETEERIHETEMLCEQLSHISGLDISLDDLFSLKHFKLRFGHMPKENYDALTAYGRDNDDFFFFVGACDKGEVWGVRICTDDDCEKTDALFNSLGFERFRLPEYAHGTPAQAYENLKKQLLSDGGHLKELRARAEEMKKTSAGEINELYGALSMLRRGYSLESKAVFSEEGFTLYGYVPARSAKKFIKEAGECCSAVKLTCTDPTPEQKSPPPTVLHNAWFFRPFEEYVRMYGAPNYREIDPTPLVALTYMLFFGVMFGDVGQGALIILAGAVMWFAKKMFIGRILTRVGITSMLFGFLYGSVFGYEDILPGFKVNEGDNMNITLVAAVCVGAVVISLCIAVNIANGIRQHDLGKALFSGNGLAALIFYWAVILVVLSAADFIPVGIPMAVIGVVIGVCLLLIMFKEPLENLLKKRKKLVPGKWSDYILENFFELFETVLSFVTNTISYIRLGAFALSHVGMMSVVFLLAQGSAGTQNPVIVVIGNIFVVGFEGMIVCIQALRLEFYEMFSRFYTGDGREPEIQ